MSHVGTGCLVAGFLTLASISGSLSFSEVLAGSVAPGGRRELLFVLFLVGFGVQAGMVPLHIWLPEAHPAAPSSVSALMSGALITTGLYGLFRVCAFGLGVPAWDWGVGLALVGSLSAILGVLYALTQNDLKRLLAYSTIENYGIILLGLGAGMMALAPGRAALAAVGFVKAFGITFLALTRGEGAEKAHESPWVMLAPQALLAGMCFVLGLAPGWVLGVLQGVTGSLPGVRPAPEMVRGLFAIAPGPGHFDHLKPPLVALPVLAVVGLVSALFLGVRYAVRRAPTWGCGGELSARTEYTATAFSKPLMMIFGAIYRPTREVSRVEEVSPYFPSAVRYRAQIEPTFERFVYGPLTRGVLGAAERMKVIQAGSLHAYLAYVMALVVTLVVLLWWKG